VFSVTPEAAASLTFQAPPPRSAKSDPSQGNDGFQALIDSSAPSDSGNDRAGATAQQQPASPRRADDTPAAAGSKRSRGAGPAHQAAANNSENRDATARQSSEADAGSNANTDVRQAEHLEGRHREANRKEIDRSKFPRRLPRLMVHPHSILRPLLPRSSRTQRHRTRSPLQSRLPSFRRILLRQRLRPATPPRRSRLPRRQSRRARRRQPRRLHHPCRSRAIQMQGPL
jgi:hypothetical protein